MNYNEFVLNALERLEYVTNKLHHRDRTMGEIKKKIKAIKNKNESYFEGISKQDEDDNNNICKLHRKQIKELSCKLQAEKEIVEGLTYNVNVLLYKLKGLEEVHDKLQTQYDKVVKENEELRKNSYKHKTNMGGDHNSINKLKLIKKQNYCSHCSNDLSRQNEIKQLLPNDQNNHKIRTKNNIFLSREDVENNFIKEIENRIEQSNHLLEIAHARHNNNKKTELSEKAKTKQNQPVFQTCEKEDLSLVEEGKFLLNFIQKEKEEIMRIRRSKQNKLAKNCFPTENPQQNRKFNENIFEDQPKLSSVTLQQHNLRMSYFPRLNFMEKTSLDKINEEEDENENENFFSIASNDTKELNYNGSNLEVLRSCCNNSTYETIKSKNSEDTILSLDDESKYLNSEETFMKKTEEKHFTTTNNQLLECNENNFKINPLSSKRTEESEKDSKLLAADAQNRIEKLLERNQYINKRMMELEVLFEIREKPTSSVYLLSSLENKKF